MHASSVNRRGQLAGRRAPANRNTPLNHFSPLLLVATTRSEATAAAFAEEEVNPREFESDPVAEALAGAAAPPAAEEIGAQRAEQVAAAADDDAALPDEEAVAARGDGGSPRAIIDANAVVEEEGADAGQPAVEVAAAAERRPTRLIRLVSPHRVCNPANPDDMLPIENDVVVVATAQSKRTFLKIALPFVGLGLMALFTGRTKATEHGARCATCA